MSANRVIYGLFYNDPDAGGVRRYFYVGRSIDALRRLRQHHYAKEKGHEDKYAFIREIEAKGVKWDHAILRTIPPGEYPADSERWFVIELTRAGHVLMNMRYGSMETRKELAEQISAPHIRSISDVERDRKSRQYLASRKTRLRVIRDTLFEEGVPNVSNDQMLPRKLHRKLLQQGVASIEAGVGLKEIARLIRSHRKIMVLLSEA